MLSSAIWILIAGFLGGQIAHRFGAPPLIGMIIVGIIIGPELANLIAPNALDLADDLRIFAVMVILMRAGLGLDRAKLKQQGSVALRLGILPAMTETVVVTFSAVWLFNFDIPTGLLLGTVVSAESPAVIVPGMLRLKSLGWGVAKGIPDVILTGSALSDVLVLLVFSLILNFLSQGNWSNQALILLPLQVMIQIVAGVALGYTATLLLIFCITKQNWTQNVIHDTIIAASIALFLVVFSQSQPYFSGYLATMSMGFFISEYDPPLARILRIEFNHLWVVAEIVLFVLMGASIQLKILENYLLPAITILVLGLIIGRSIGWYLATIGSNWTWREKLFLLPGNSAKATVQAAIGAIPFSMGIEGGEIILAIAALSILITAPLGAWGIPTFAPALLTQDTVDPTKVTVASHTLLLAAIDTSNFAPQVLTQVAEMARRSNGEVIVLHVVDGSGKAEIEQLSQRTKHLLLDIRYQFITVTGSIAEAIVDVSQQYQVTEIVMGKRGHKTSGQILIGSVSQAVLETSLLPILIVEEDR